MFPPYTFDPVQSQTEWYTHNGDSPWEEKKYDIDHFYPGAFAYHWHNRWHKAFHANSEVAALLKKYEKCDPPKPVRVYEKITRIGGGGHISDQPALPVSTPSATTPRKIFIDLGAYTGDTLILYRDHFLFNDTFERVVGTNWKSMAEVFEVEPENLQIILDRFRTDLADVKNITTLYPVAAWNQDALVSFQTSSKGSNKNDGALGGSGAVKVLCYDIGAWFMKHIKPSNQDNILLKMDIESAEVEALDSLEKAGALDFVDHLAIEWHDWIDPKVQSQRARLDAVLNARGLFYQYATLDDNFVRRYVERGSWPVNHCDSHYFRKR
jgi:hypothetical protein